MSSPTAQELIEAELAAATADDSVEAALVRIRALLGPSSLLSELQANYDVENGEAIRNAKTFGKALLDYAGVLAVVDSRTSNALCVDLLTSTTTPSSVYNNAADSERALLFKAVALYQLGRYREARLACERVLLRQCAGGDTSLQGEQAARVVLDRVRAQVSRKGWSGVGLIAAVAVLASVLGLVLAGRQQQQQHERD